MSLVLQVFGHKLAWLRPPTYFRSIFISLQYSVWDLSRRQRFLSVKFLPVQSANRGRAEADDVGVSRQVALWS